MNDSKKWTSLIYDKCYNSVDHDRENKLFKDVSISDLQNEDNYNCLHNEEAISMFNSSILVDIEDVDKYILYYKIPILNHNFYKIKLYCKKNSKIPVTFVIVDINTHLIEKCIRCNKPIPNKRFSDLLMLFNSYYTYTDNNYINNKINIIKQITEKTMEIKEYSDVLPIDDPIDKIDKYNLLTEKLYFYQKCSINWMLKKELNLKKLDHTQNKIIKLSDNLCYNYDKEEFSITDTYINFYGGGLFDEVGLGKTIQMTTLSLLNPCKDFSQFKKGSNKIHSVATLIICPNTLCGQWKRELVSKISSKRKPNIITLLTKRDLDKYTYNDLTTADFVVVSFTYLNNKNCVKVWLTPGKPLTWLKTKDFDNVATQKMFDNKYESFMRNPLVNLNTNKTIIQLIHWYRIVVDEFHEVHSNANNNYIANVLPYLKGTYKWCVTGTPFINDNSLYNMTNFITNYEIDKYKNDIFNNENFVEYVSTNCFRRNTKLSVKNEYTLPPIEEEVLWLQFTATERMMYNSYLANENNNSYSVYLRKLCCHPQLADETKTVLSNCKTLKDIEKMMVIHYKKDALTTKHKIYNLNQRIIKNIMKINECMNSIKKTRIKRIVTKMGYDIEEEVDVFQLLDSNEDSDQEMVDSEESIEKQSAITLETDIEEDLKNYSINNIDDYNTQIEVVLELCDIKDKKENIIKKVRKKVLSMDTIESNTIDNLSELLKNKYDQKEKLNKEFDGKMVSYNFFNNVIDRLRKVKDSTTKTPAITDTDADTNVMNYLSQTADSDDEDEEDLCAICLGEIEEEDCGVTKCGHIYCYACIKVWTDKYKNCPYCKKSLNVNETYILSYEKKTKGGTAEDKKKDELINEIGTKLANLIFFLKKSDKHTIIFSQWDDLLNKVGKTLKQYGIKNVFCKGNVFQRDKAIREFNMDDKIKVIMLSSESAASGTNLTKATQIVLLDPVYGDYKFRKETENQAIGRAHRLGQKSKLRVIRLVIKETLEQEIYEQNIKEDEKYMLEHKNDNYVPNSEVRKINVVEVK